MSGYKQVKENNGILDINSMKFGSFSSVENFRSYYERHYIPIFKKLYNDTIPLNEEEKRLLSFLDDDLQLFLSEQEKIINI